MPRANRYFIPGYVWHITHRCHKQEFLLKFAKDRQRWRHWLFEARKRYGLCVLNYIVTSNHVHLLVRDLGQGEIAQSMQLISGRIAQEYNQRKARKGAFWEDRYHATAVDTEEYLARCMTYIDLNMVRAGVVMHPAEWDSCGYREIQKPPLRYGVINQTALMEIFGFNSQEQLQQACRAWTDETLQVNASQRDSTWTQNLAVGRLTFITQVKETLGIKAQYRKVGKEEDLHVLREPAGSYNRHYGAEKHVLNDDNKVFLD